MGKREIAQIVNKHLTQQLLDNIYFVADEANIQGGDSWWRVPVRPSRLPEQLFKFYELLAEVEEEIREQENVNVLLMTGEPLEEETAAPAPGA